MCCQCCLSNTNTNSNGMRDSGTNVRKNVLKKILKMKMHRIQNSLIFYHTLCLLAALLLDFDLATRNTFNWSCTDKIVTLC